MKLEKFIKRIDDVEKNVDRVLKAARLERHERQPMSREMLAMILNYAMGTVAMILGFVALYMVIYYAGN